MPRNTASPHRPVIALLAAIALVLAACGGGGSDDSNAGGPTTAADAAPAPAGGGETGGEGTAGEAPSSDDDPSNPWVLGFQVSLQDGETGQANVSVEATGINGDIRYDPLMMDWTIGPDDVPHLLFSAFMEAGEVEVEVEGTAVDVIAVWGRSSDPEDPFGSEIDIREVLSTTTVEAGTTSTVSFP